MELVYEDLIPISWRAVADTISDEQRLRVSVRNEDALRIIAGLDDLSERQAEEEGLRNDMARLELKVNVLLELVGSLYAHQESLPDATTVRLNTSTVAWMAEPMPPIGTTLQVEAYLSRRYPRPITFIGRSEALATGGEATVSVILDQLHDGERDLLEKYIFRQHRRLVATSRKAIL